MRIAVCDAEYDSRMMLQEILNRYQSRRAAEVQVVCFETAQMCLNALEQDAGFDLLFSAILLPDMNGIELARHLRRIRPALRLVYVTSSRDYALEAYDVNARQYLLKPVKEESVFLLLDELFRHEEKAVLLASNTGLKKIYPQSLVWGEVQGHNLLWHFRGAETVQSRCTIQQALELIQPYGAFVQVHRSFFVNLEYVGEVRRSDFSLHMEDGTVLYIPKTKFAGFHRKYQQFWQAKTPLSAPQRKNKNNA